MTEEKKSELVFWRFWRRFRKIFGERIFRFAFSKYAYRRSGVISLVPALRRMGRKRIFLYQWERRINHLLRLLRINRQIQLLKD